MASILVCTKCWQAWRSQGTVPAVCPMCGKTPDWMMTSLTDEPEVPYVLSLNDRAFLHKLHIDTDEAPVTGTVET